MHASPIEPGYLITKESGMYYENDLLTQKLSAGSISFYPACDTLLHKADVEYMVCDDILYQVDHTLSKTMIARAETRMPARTVWVGLAVDDSLTDLENVSFYLDFPTLPKAMNTCSCFRARNGPPVETPSGWSRASMRKAGCRRNPPVPSSGAMM